MRSFILTCLLIAGTFAMFYSFLCAVATVATNDYWPIVARGIGVGVLALACFAILIWQWRENAIFYLIFGILPSLIALGELLFRAAGMFLRALECTVCRDGLALRSGVPPRRG